MNRPSRIRTGVAIFAAVLLLGAAVAASASAAAFEVSKTGMLNGRQLTANGEVDLLNTVTIDISICKVTIGPQGGLKAVTYENNSGKINVNFAISGTSYRSSNGFCGRSGTNGAYEGQDEHELEGGRLKFIP